MTSLQRAFPLGVAIGAIVAMLLGFFVGGSAFLHLTQTLVTWVGIIVVCGLLWGVVGMIRRHVHIVVRSQDNWPYSVVLLASMALMIVNGLFPGSTGPNDQAVAWGFDYVYTPMSASFFALLAFFAASAAYRTLRVRSLAVGAMAIGAIVALIGQNLVVLQAIPWIADLRRWLLDYPVAAGLRAVVLGVSVGVIVVGLRIAAGAERRYLG